MIYIKHFGNKIEAMLKQKEQIRKDLFLNRIDIKSASLLIDDEKPISFYAVKSDNGYRIIIDFTGTIKTADGKYSYNNYNFIYCAPKVIDSEERVMELIKLLKREYIKNKMNFLIENRPFISILDDEIKQGL